MATNNVDLVLQAFFKNPSINFHVRSLARNTGLNPNTIINITNTLEQEGILTKHKEIEMNRVLIKQTRNSSFLIKKIAYNLETILSSGLIEYLNEQLSYPVIILFGSYAKGENHEKSDIDLFIITPEKKTLTLSNFEKKLSSEIQLFIHTKQEFKLFRKSSRELANNVINGIKLTGFLEAY